MTRSAGTVSCFSLAGSQLSVGSQALEMWGLSSHPADNKPMLGGHSTVITLAHSQLQECYFLICAVYIYIYMHTLRVLDSNMLPLCCPMQPAKCQRIMIHHSRSHGGTKMYWCTCAAQQMGPKSGRARHFSEGGTAPCWWPENRQGAARKKVQ